MITHLSNLHSSLFTKIEALTEGWFLGLTARFLFLAILFQYYINSAFTKVGTGFSGFFRIQDGAYFQIIPKVIERFDYNSSNVPFLYDLVVVAGTYTEFILPILISLKSLT